MEWISSRGRGIGMLRLMMISQVPARLPTIRTQSAIKTFGGRANEGVVFLKILGIKLQKKLWITNSPESPDEANVTFKEGNQLPLTVKKWNWLTLSRNECYCWQAWCWSASDHVRELSYPSHEIYEWPRSYCAFWQLIKKWGLTLVREVSHFKYEFLKMVSNLIYNAVWFSPATQAIIAYIKETQKVVNGIAKVQAL